MLVQFTVGNYRSFAEPQTLSFEATSISEYPENTFESNNTKLLNGIALYGANSSGKSNFLGAIGEMKDFIFSTFNKSSSNELNYDPFLLRESLSNSPSIFEVVFIHKSMQYRYGFEVTSKSIEGEWLFHTRQNKESPLFVREKDGIEIFSEFQEGINLESKTRNNSLFLTVVDQFNGEISNQIISWFHNFNVIDGIKHNNYRSITYEMLENEEHNDKLNNFFKELDLGFQTIEIIKEEFDPHKLNSNLPEELLQKLITDLEGKNMTTMLSSHNVYDDQLNPTGTTKEFNVRQRESSGTNKVIDLSGPIFDTIKDGGILAIDELDAKLHPLLTIALVRLFHNKSINTKNAQLIFSTHNTTILKRGSLRRDQIYFIEKNKAEASEVYSLVEYDMNGKKVRKDNSFEKDYLNRRYGAVPNIGLLNDLEWQEK